MLGAKLASLAKQGTAQALGLRVAIVGLNFAVMLGLAALLGFETFGRLAAVWGAALVAGTVVSLGGPVILLRMLTDGQGMRAVDICKIAVLFPCLLALLVWTIGMGIWPDMPWAAILIAGFVTNVLVCLATVMRALGSVQASMALRDAGPQVALGVAGVAGQGAQAEVILLGSAGTMCALSVAGFIWIYRRRCQLLLSTGGRPYFSMSLWAASVLGMAVAQMDLIVGGAVMSAEQLGVYAVLRRIANLVALPVTVATWVSSPDISAAHGAGDRIALARASAYGSQIAMLPGLALFGFGVLLVPLLPYVLPQQAGGGSALVFSILLLGALGQVALASSFTVVTLCGLPGLALAARLLMVLLYLLWSQWWGTELSATSNALGYAGALTLGGIALWWAAKRRLDIDTSARVLLRAKGGQWRTS
ncbi:lipopolysaccharide biosynthesis protein [Yoonia sp.]|uniref:lipopolysaccharide biosynthesis protein n=1 Tax=Yoonia sp. TaxID=2212373 RepID=UPI0039771613